MTSGVSENHMMRSITIAVLGFATVAPAQEPADPVALRDALVRWAEAFDDEGLEPAGDFRRHARVYGATLEPGGVLLRYANSREPFTNRQMLDRLMTAAERSASPALAAGMLALAGVGLERSPLDGDAMLVRDLAAGAVARASAGSPDFASAVAAIAADVDAAVAPRVAALRSLALGDRDDQDRALVAGLADDDVRVRLAAAESLRRRADPEALAPLAAVLRSESHPVVAQALVQAIAANLRRDASGERSKHAVGTAVARIGELGWRVDLEVVDLIARFPIRDAVPRLLGLLEELPADRGRTRSSEHAQQLRTRTIEVLRGLTGARLPEDSVSAWRGFWEQEGPNLQLRALPSNPRVGRTTTGGWFGIEVRGQETAFVLDVSRSMRTAVGGAGPDAGLSRLDYAVRQLIEVAQGMPREWRLRVIAFADEPHVWNDRGVRADSRTMRALTSFLEVQRPGGRSDLRQAIAIALGADALRFGRQSEHPVDEVFVFSDGLPTGANGPEEPDSLLAWVREINRYQKIRIHAVMAGDGALGADFMRRLAAENGGEFVQR